MRRLIVLGLAVVMVLPAGATRRVSVGQLGQAITAASSGHRTDAEIAHQISLIELSERLTQPTLERLSAKLNLGPKATLALELLADQSAFLDAPISERPATATPDQPTQRHIVETALRYAIDTKSRLPNFFATLTTYRFDDSPQVLAPGGWPVRAGLHPIASWAEEATYRGGQDVRTPVEASANAALPEVRAGLTSWGEFGPVVALVISDAARGKLGWGHWEHSPAGPVAVFNYSVPKGASHYSVSYCCTGRAPDTPSPVAGRGRTGAGTLQTTPAPNSAKDNSTFHENPGYRGTIAIDPATGAILRLTLEAALSGGDPLLRAAIAVEYGPVSIGDKTFICPVRSLALSVADSTPERIASRQWGDTTVSRNRAVDGAWGGPLSRPPRVPFLQLNETRFTNYHRLGSTMRVLGESSAAKGLGVAAQTSDVPATAKTGEANASSPQIEQPIETMAALEAPAAVPAPIPAPAVPVTPEISTSAATGVPDEPAVAVQPRDSLYSLKLTSRLVDVGVVAYDKKGRPVTDLKAEDFEIYDDGQRQQVRFFSPAPGMVEAAPSAPASEQPTGRFSNRAIGRVVDPASTAAAAPDSGATILLIDESHIAWSDMTNARDQMIAFLGKVSPAERVGLYTMTSLGFRVLVEITADHAGLIERLKKFVPTAQSLSQAQEEENRNRQHIDEVRNVSDLNSVNGNQNDVPDGQQTVDPQLRAMGNNPIRASLIILATIARHLAAVPGHKNVVWVSTDNVFADWRDQAVGVDKGPNAIDSFVIHAQEAMNEAHAAVYPFDVSQLEPAATTADLQHMNVELAPAAKDMASLGGGQAPKSNAPGRITAEMQQNIHPIQGRIREVAESTGGRAIRRSGDLAAALSSIVEDGRATYQLSFSPAGQADDRYHSINIKLNGKRGVTLRFRTGYLFSKEPVTLKDRFQNAVWRPLDVTEIAITAEVARTSAATSVKVNIAAGDLGLQQQADRWMDKLDIFLIQRDDAGLRTNVDGTTLGLRLKPSTYQNVLTQGVPFESQVVLKPGMASLRVLVVDENSGRMGSVTVPAMAVAADR